MKKISILIIGVLLAQASNSQNKSDILKYAHQIIDTLSSPSMHGRGYINKGESIAAEYLKNEFQKNNLKPVKHSYYQSFFLPVNTIPTAPWVRIDGKELVPGKDYLLVNATKANNGKYPLVWLDTNVSLKKVKKIKNSALTIPSIHTKCKSRELLQCLYYDCMKLSNKVVLTREKKLTWSVETDTSSLTQLIILDSVIKKENKFIELNVEQTFIPTYESQNVMGYIKGTQYPDSFIVFSAHYDHLGRMGKDVYFPGANDNASGCAMLLSLAKYYSQYPPKYSIAFMAFGAEEAGLLGSKHYVENPLFPLKQIKFLVNMDIMGTGDEGIKVVNATEYKKEFDALLKINEEKKLLASVQPRGKAKNSDHYFFSEAGVKAFFIYTLGGIKAYHDIYDRRETLPLTKFEDTFKLLTEFSDYLQK